MNYLGDTREREFCLELIKACLCSSRPIVNLTPFILNVVKSFDLIREPLLDEGTLQQVREVMKELNCVLLPQFPLTLHPSYILLMHSFL